MFYRVIFIFTVFLSFNLFASNLENIKSFQASFTQTIVNASKKSIVYSGDVFIKKEGKILWRYKTPIIKNVYVIKNIAMIDEPELEQVIYTQLQNDMNLISLIKNAKLQKEDHYITALQNIEYHLFFKQNELHKITYIDALENQVTIAFENIQQDANISDELFRFFPPEHYDIIRQ